MGRGLSGTAARCGLVVFAAVLMMAASAACPTPGLAQDATASRVPSDVSAQHRRLRGTQLRVYRRTLSPTAVRACDAWYEQEYRPSGTVIVPRMRCHWIDG